MRHHALLAMACVMACCTVANSSQAAFNVGIPNFTGMRPSPSLNRASCCHHQRRWRWYWSPEPYNPHFDLYYGWLAARSPRHK
jgi:hypothetical protein